LAEKTVIGQGIEFQGLPIHPSVARNDANLIRNRSRHVRGLQISRNPGGNETVAAADVRQFGNNA
jgi:hypothetical protein